MSGQTHLARAVRSITSARDVHLITGNIAQVMGRTAVLAKYAVSEKQPTRPTAVRSCAVGLVLSGSLLPVGYIFGFLTCPKNHELSLISISRHVENLPTWHLQG